MKQDDLNAQITLKSTIGLVGGVTAFPVLFLWAAWMQNADALADIIAFGIWAFLVFLLSFVLWYWATSSK